MQREIEKLRDLRGELVALGVSQLSVFGSRVKGTARGDSDIDVIIDYPRGSGFSLLDLVAVARLIEGRLGIRADVTTRSGLHPVLADEIQAQAVQVF